MDNFNLIMAEIDRYRKIEIPKFVARIKKQSKFFTSLSPLIRTIKDVELLRESKWRIIAVDGGTDHTSLEGVGFAVASARAFTITIGEAQISDMSNIQLFDTPASDVASIVSTTFMKGLEYKIAKEAIEKIDDEIQTLVLLDGAITFPDTSINITKIKELSKAYQMFEKYANEFFDYIEKRENISVIAVSKDARRAKYLRGLFKSNSVKITSVIERETIEKLRKIIEDESWRERIALQYAIRNKNPTKPSYCEPVNVAVSGITHGEVPVRILKNKGIYGTYYLYPNASHALYLELPAWDLTKLKSLLEIFNDLCRISPVLGYPYPLVYVDELTRVTKSFSSKLFSQLVYEIRNIAPDIARDIVATKMRESLH